MNLNKLKMVINKNGEIPKVENETKLVIDGKEFELIKYSCDTNDKWYCGELGLMIEKQVGTGTNPEIPKGSIKWWGASSGKENRQLEKLIYFGEDRVKYWKRNIKALDTVLDSENKNCRVKDLEKRLERAEKGLKELKELQKGN